MSRKARFDLVVIGASAGGKEALRKLLSGLPRDFPCAIVVVQHLPKWRASVILNCLVETCSLPVKEVQKDDSLQAGVVFVAPPDRHVLTLPGGWLRLSKGQPINGQRPSVDALFVSVAAVYGRRAVAVVLTGKGKDGAAGAEAIKREGGMVLVQDPKTAAFEGMPNAAVKTGSVDLVLQLDKIAAMLADLISTSS